MQSSESPIIGDLKSAAAAVAIEIAGAVTDGGILSPALRQRFIAVRAELFKRGIFDPVLARFDSATVPAAQLPEIAQELAKVAERI